MLLVMACNSSSVIADTLTYSPDQWPRHWNVLFNQTHQQKRLNNNTKYNNRYARQRPARSMVWGMAPVVKQKPRRSLRPEYNTNSHIRNYSGQNIYPVNYYSGFVTPYTTPMVNPYVAPMLVPGMSSGFAPGLAAPGIPFSTFPYSSPLYGTRFPYMGGIPMMGY